jgi:dihydroxyacetone kinase
MQKIMNSPDSFVDDSLRGMVLAHPDIIRFCPGSKRGLVRANKPEGRKVAIVTGGGFGHLPVFLGYVGEGLCDGCAVGNVFTSPSFESIIETAREADCGAGVLFLFGNYMGDSMNFEMSSEMLEMEGIESRVVKCSDDAASFSREKWHERRGVGGIAFAYKLVGSFAESADSLDATTDFAGCVCSDIATLGFAMSSCQLPGASKPIFDIGGDEMELGMGIHGEPGIERVKTLSADELAERIVPKLADDLSLKRGDEVSVLVNSLSATSDEELYILYGDVAARLLSRGIGIHKAYVGRYATSMEMAGASVSFLKMNDEYGVLLDREENTPLVRF